MDDFIDIVEGNRKYVKCLYVYNKIDTVCIEDVWNYYMYVTVGGPFSSSSLFNCLFDSNEFECRYSSGAYLGIHGSFAYLHQETR